MSLSRSCCFTGNIIFALHSPMGTSIARWGKMRKMRGEGGHTQNRLGSQCAAIPRSIARRDQRPAKGTGTIGDQSRLLARFWRTCCSIC